MLIVTHQELPIKQNDKKDKTCVSLCTYTTALVKDIF